MFYVYLVVCENGELFKIGKTNDLTKRLPSLNKYYNFDYFNSYYFELNSEKEALELESFLHDFGNKYRVNILNKTDGYTEFFDIKYLDLLLTHLVPFLSVFQFDFKLKTIYGQELVDDSSLSILFTLNFPKNFLDTKAFQKILRSLVFTSLTSKSIFTTKDSLFYKIDISKILNLENFDYKDIAKLKYFLSQSIKVSLFEEIYQEEFFFDSVSIFQNEIYISLKKKIKNIKY